MNLILSFLLLFCMQIDFLLSQKKSSPRVKKEIKHDQEAEEYLELFQNVFDRLSTTYVDSINKPEIILSGIKGLMLPLDPYTKILMGRSKDNYEVLRRGKYGGIGISIDEVRDTIIVTSVYQDSPSYFEGLSPGDMIIQIDTTNAINIGVRKAVKLLKGEIDDKLDITIYRKKEKSKQVFTLRRGNISVSNVPYWGINEDKIGYIRINKFSKNTSELFAKGLDELSDLGMKGLIVDLRLNGGGLLNESIKILDTLLPIDLDNPILYRKGRTRDSEYYSRNEPNIDSSVPIVLLQDKRSASASEIVSGVLQDLDRAIIIGEKSFGKGLVQITNTLNDSISLKVTTAKYYLPSGRLIQKSDYLGNGVLTDGLDKKDSVFYTLNMREVLGGKGILPDIKMNKDRMPSFVASLWKSERLFVSFSENIYSSLTNNSIAMYKHFIMNKYPDSYSILDSNIFYIDALKGYDDYSERLSSNKNLIIDLNKKLSVIQEANKIYKQLNKYEKYQNLTNKDLDNIVYHVYNFKNYFSSGPFDSKRPTSKILKTYIEEVENGLQNGPLVVAGHNVYQIILKLLGIMNSIELKKLDDSERFIDGVNYGEINTSINDIKSKLESISKQIQLQGEAISWYVGILSNNITSPHLSVPISEYDREFIDKNIDIKKINRKMARSFKNYIEEYNFQYKIEGEREFDKLKDALNSYEDFSLDTLSSKKFFQSYFKNKKFKKTVRDLERFLIKKKETYFFKDENLDWVINGILREYSRISLGNVEAVKTSLYVDSQYYDSMEYLIDLNIYNDILSKQ